MDGNYLSFQQNFENLSYDTCEPKIFAVKVVKILNDQTLLDKAHGNCDMDCEHT